MSKSPETANQPAPSPPAHTPRPWHVNAIMGERIVGGADVANADKYMIANYNATIARVYRPKDARLIAAAPDLLQALKYAAFLIDCNPPGNTTPDYIKEIRSAARSAIARAEG